MRRFAARSASTATRFPPEAHQDEVHALAKDYLRCQNSRDKLGVQKLLTEFEKDVLLGVEVLDEALVLWKNDPKSWPQVDNELAFYIGEHYDRLYKEVVKLRGGRPRQTTTPTLRGGGKRQAGKTSTAKAQTRRPWWKFWG